MSTALLNAILWPPAWGLCICGLLRRIVIRRDPPSPAGPAFFDVRHPWYPWCQWFMSGVIQLCLYSVVRYPPKDHVTISPAWGSLANVIAALLWLAWKRRKDIKRKLAALGNKGLARLQAMVKTLRERTAPRPVLRPLRIPA